MVGGRLLLGVAIKADYYRGELLWHTGSWQARVGNARALQLVDGRLALAGLLPKVTVALRIAMLCSALLLDAAEL